MNNQAKTKGALLEDVVARLHTIDGLDVSTRVKLPTIGNPGATREIDVLLKESVGGYPVQIAIECKNESRPVTVGQMSEFIDKLRDVGLSTRPSVFVSIAGFQSGALRRAAENGVRALRLEGLTPDRLKLELLEAISHTVFLTATISEFTLTTTGTEASPCFADRDGTYGGSVPDVIWRGWVSDSSLLLLGQHERTETVPECWKNLVGVSLTDVLGISYKIVVTGHVLQTPGTFTLSKLRDSITGEFLKAEANATFDLILGKHKLQVISTEDELLALLGKTHVQMSIVQRVQVPRILLGSIGWPPDTATLKRMSQDIEAHRDEYDAGTRRFQQPPMDDIADLLMPPNGGFLMSLRERFGSTWPHHIWQPFLSE